MNTKFFPFLICLFFLTTSTLFANPQVQFEKANTAYQAGDYEMAIKNYEQVIQAGAYSSEIYYNVGNAYFKTDKLGKAILNYERALLITPRDADVHFNLEIANAKKMDDLDQIGKFFLAEWWQRLHKFLSARIWGTLTILSLWAGIAGLIMWLFGATRIRKKQGFLGGISLLVLSLFLYFISNSQAKFEKNSQTAIILVNSIELKNGPDSESTAVLAVHEGLKVELLDQIGDWYKVKLSNGDQGWLPKNSLEEI